MVNIQEPYDIQDNGVIGIGKDERDWILGQDLDILRLAPIQNDTRYHYNQATLLGGKLRSFCTVMSPIQILSSMFDVELEEQDFEDLREFAQKEYGYKEGVGNYIKVGVDCAVKRWNNEFPQHKVVYLRTRLLSDDVKYVWGKGYSVCSGYRGDWEYNRDRDDNGIVDGIKFGNTYGHAVPVREEDGEIKVDDSYKGRPTNVYGLADLIGLRSGSTFYPTAYIIVPDPENAINDEIRKKKLLFDNIMVAMEQQNSSMRHQIEQHPTATNKQKQEVKEATHRLNNAFRDIRG